MSRPLRIEYPGAWYHVMNRGRRSEKIFLDKNDYKTFIDLLIEACELWNVYISAYSLMPNHYHLLINTPEGNQSRFMRHINGVYTQRFNKSHIMEGQLFKGRYKSILVGGDSYLLQLVRYIHRNSLRAKIVKEIDDFQWSSHQAYVSTSKGWDWLRKDLILSIFSENKKERIKEYWHYISQKDKNELIQILERKKLPTILGRDEFIFTIKEKYYQLKKNKEIPESYSLSPGYEVIKEAVCRYYRIDKEELQKSKRNKINLPRNIAIYITRNLRRDTLDKIGLEFSLNRYSSVSSVLNRTKELIKRDKRLQRIVEEIIKTIVNKGQS